MSAKSRSRGRLVVATDSRGEIVAAALTTDDAEVQTGLEPMDGQTVHELEIPTEFEAIDSPHAMLAALVDARMTRTGALKMREVRVEE